MLPTMNIGDLTVSRLIVGSNPFTGKSHLDQQVDADTSALKKQVEGEKEWLKYMKKLSGLEMLLEHGAL